MAHDDEVERKKRKTRKKLQTAGYHAMPTNLQRRKHTVRKMG